MARGKGGTRRGQTRFTEETVEEASRDGSEEEGSFVLLLLFDQEGA